MKSFDSQEYGVKTEDSYLKCDSITESLDKNFSNWIPEMQQDKSYIGKSVKNKRKKEFSKIFKNGMIKFRDLPKKLKSNDSFHGDLEGSKLRLPPIKEPHRKKN